MCMKKMLLSLVNSDFNKHFGAAVYGKFIVGLSISTGD